MNILYGRTDLNIAGPGIVMLKTSSQLVSRGHKVVVASGGGVLEGEFKNNNVIVEKIDELSISKRSPLYVIIAIIKLAKVMKKHDIGLVNGHNMFFTLLAYVASMLARVEVRFYTTIHGVGKEWVCKYLPGKVIAVSSYVKNNLVSHGADPRKISIVHNGLIDISLYKNEQGNPANNQNKFTMISVAMMTGLKGQDKIIRVLKKVIETKPDVCLILVGDGVKKNELKELAKKKGVYSDIKFLGRRNDVPDLLKSSDLFIHLPEYETFGMVVMEAMASGLPVIASKTGGIPEIVKNGWSGMLVDNSDIDDVADKVINLIEDQDKRVKFKNNSLQIILEHFQIEKTINNLEDIYSS